MSNSREKKHSAGINIGSASILLIFVTLCLVSFATLAIVSANADSKLSKRVLERTTAYYEACNSAEEALASIDSTLADVYVRSASADEYFAAVGHSKSYTIPVTDIQTLQVIIEIQYPESENDSFYTITSWQVLTADDAADLIIP